MAVILESSHREFRAFVADGTGIQPVLPIIVTEHGVLEPFAHYMHLNRLYSRSWQESVTFAVQLLLEYIEANQRFYDSPRALFTAFSNALFTGTVSNRTDPSGLWWRPRRPSDASKLIDHVTRFTDWLAAINEDAKLQLNPWRQATQHEQRLNWAAYSHRRDNAFLSHLWRTNPNIHQSRVIRSRPLLVDRQAPINAFPEEHFDALISEGFRRRACDSRGAVDLRNILITYLMHYGGLRLSEALSLWKEDVDVVEGEVVVRIFHPEHGLAPDGKSSRTDYLQDSYGLQPRNKLVKATDPLFLGWKNSLITDPQRHCFEVIFYPSEMGKEFLKLWFDYHLKKQRVKPEAGEEHPYAFTNKDGRPYSHRMFRRAHKLAVDRVGLPYEKIHGTTPHGHRHAYGQRLANGGASPLIIKNAMHHALISSSQAYTKPTTAKLRQSLCDLEERLRLQHARGPQVSEII